jgi:hypothetical protein
VRSIISLSKLIDGGAAIFHAENKNHHMEIVGPKATSPFVKYILRVCVISYVKLAKINNPEEHRPCATIIIIDPHIAQFELLIAAARSNPIWPTDEYAIKDLMSDCRKQIILVTIAPITEILNKSEDTKVLLILLNKKIIRKIPYPPNFKRIAASTIDPAIGAST